MRRRLGLALLAASLTTVLSVAVPLVASGARPLDRFWVRPGATEVPIRRIAFLPVGRSAGPTTAMGAAIEESWLVRFIDDGHDWIPPDICAAYMASMSRQRPDSTREAILGQVAKTGQPDSADASRLARRLRCQALLTIRIDRWERVLETDKTVSSTHVELTATIVDSAGRTLWTATGEQHLRSRYGVPMADRAAAGFTTPTVTTQRTSERVRTSSGALVTVSGTATSVVDKGKAIEYSLNAGFGASVGSDYARAVAAIFDRWAVRYPWLAGGAAAGSRESGSR